MRKTIVVLVVSVIVGFGFGVARSAQPAPRSGCCSSHGGVCGCNIGRAVCCDGTISKTCDCN